MLIFDRTVVINNPVRVSLLQDISTHRENGAISSLEDAKISTVDNEHQSTILAFELPSELRQQMAESLRTHSDWGLLIDSGAIFTAEGCTDVTAHLDTGSILVTDLTIVR